MAEARRMWMVRAGKGSTAAETFEAKSVIGIGWYGVDWTKYEGAPKYGPSAIEELPTLRAVKWDARVRRDTLSEKTLKRLGAISTLFLISDSAAAELEANREPL